MYHIFFIHSSVDEYLGCVNVLDTVYSVAMNTEGACIFLNYDFPQIICPGVGMLDHLVALFLVF